jgi:hypothetical protein
MRLLQPKIRHHQRLEFDECQNCELNLKSVNIKMKNCPTLFDFNHAIVLPQKNGKAYPLFDYEQMFFDILQTHKHV